MADRERAGLFAVLHASPVLEGRVESRLAAICSVPSRRTNRCSCGSGWPSWRP